MEEEAGWWGWHCVGEGVLWVSCTWTLTQSASAHRVPPLLLLTHSLNIPEALGPGSLWHTRSPLSLFFCPRPCIGKEFGSFIQPTLGAWPVVLEPWCFPGQVGLIPQQRLRQPCHDLATAASLSTSSLHSKL